MILHRKRVRAANGKVTGADIDLFRAFGVHISALQFLHCDNWQSSSMLAWTLTLIESQGWSIDDHSSVKNLQRIRKNMKRTNWNLG